MPADHAFHAVAFAENFSLKELAAAFPDAQRTGHELVRSLPGGGELFLYPFGAVVFRDVEAPRRDTELALLRERRPGLSPAVVEEELIVREEASQPPGVEGERLIVDRLTPGRAGIVGLTVAQSAAMEYYERIVEEMFVRTGAWVERLERKGTVPMQTRPLHRFIGEAIATRTEVLSVLHLLDKPEAVWDDPAIDAIYEDLRAEFDLSDRYGALELKLRSVQEALELVATVARDRRLVVLEAAIVGLIVVELALSLLRAH